MVDSNEENLDAEWLYDKCARCNIKQPTEAQEDAFLDEVKDWLGKSVTLHHARISAFMKVMTK